MQHFIKQVFRLWTFYVPGLKYLIRGLDFGKLVNSIQSAVFSPSVSGTVVVIGNYLVCFLYRRSNFDWQKGIWPGFPLLVPATAVGFEDFIPLLILTLTGIVETTNLSIPVVYSFHLVSLHYRDTQHTKKSLHPFHRGMVVFDLLRVAVWDKITLEAS
jgi:hypothetical protein